MTPDIRPGSVVASRFEILSPPSAGGMGVVFKAHDRKLDEVVALKLLPPGADEDRHGTVVLRILVDESGRVAQVSVVTGVDLLTEVAVSAVRKWTYKPALSGGVPVKRWLEIPAHFDLPR